MCTMSVLCPLCAQTSFSSIDALRCSLIKAANGPLACPICHDMFLGLDKLTIHLFSHTNIMNAATNKNNNNNNNNNISASEEIIATPRSNIQTIKNIEKFETNEIENLNKTQKDSKNSNSNNVITKQNQNMKEFNLENTHHHHHHHHYTQFENKKNVVEKATVATKADQKIVNNLNSTLEQVVADISEQEESKKIENLATCDICELTFRNEELRNMHIRLVHQNFDCHARAPNNCLNNNSSPIISAVNSCGIDRQTATQEHEFKCHLCSKTFKMKGSLRIHLKVVHLMGLPYVNNIPKLSICDRIRHKENKLLKQVNNLTNTNISLSSDNLIQKNLSPTLNYENNNSLFNIQPINFSPKLNPLPTTPPNVSLVNLNQSLDYPQNSMDNSIPQAQNVLLVFNTASTQKISQNVNTLSNTVPSSNTSNTVIATLSTEKEISTKLNSNMCGNVAENPKIWECDVCSKAFTTKYFLKKHKRLHTGEMPYTCEICARTFTFQQSYHKHLLYHSDEKPHVCSTCGRAFKELSTLHNHERIHSGEKPFKCEVCGKSFRQRVSFLVHTRIHTGVMPYKCKICQRSFRYKVSQRTHKCQSLSAEESLSPVNDATTIDHMSENFIKEFLETSIAKQSVTHLSQSHNSPASNEIASINEKSSSLNEQQALLSKTIDDIVVESCNKMGIGSTSFNAEHIVNEEGSMSPSQKLQNMSLYSPQLVTPYLNSIEEGDLTRFFLENS